MTNKILPPPSPEEDTLVTRARRKETIRGALKLFRVILDSIRRHAEWVETRHGIGAAHLWVLWELHQNPGMRSVDLAKYMAVRRQTAENLLRELMEKSLAREESNQHAAIYFTTSAGERIAAAAPEYGQGVLKAGLERLPDSALEQLVSTLRVLTEALPIREDQSALTPMADLLRPTPRTATPKHSRTTEHPAANTQEK
jgi:DNA-binding MarR family transcriptional regulator